MLFTSYYAIGQVKFSATASPQEINKDEYVRLRLVVENAKQIEQITPPLLKHFDIISGPSQETGMSSINGVVKSYAAISFILRPQKTGNITIPAATAKVDGKEYHSNAVTVKVNNSITGNNATPPPSSPFNNVDPFANAESPIPYEDYILKKGEDITQKINRNMFVKIDVDKTTCFIGEPIIATYKLYTRLESESNVIKNPSFNRFSVIDLQQSNATAYQQEKLNGKEYNVYIIRQVQLYPLQSGNLELEAAEVENNVRFIKEEYIRRHMDMSIDIWDDFANAVLPSEGVTNQKVILQSKPLSILVKPLPSIGIPQSFKGAVGDFSIQASIHSNTFTTDDVAQLTITISGKGNLQMVTVPEIAWPGDVETFEPKVSNDLHKTTVPVSGKKVIEIPFIITQAGNYTIPPIYFSFFNPKEEKYRTVATAPIHFTAIKGIDTNTNSSSIEKSNKNPSLQHRFFNNGVMIACTMAILIAISLIFWLKSGNKKNGQIEEKEMASLISNQPIEEILQSQQNPLILAKENLLKEDESTFYKQLNLSIKNYLSHKFNIASENLNKKNISEELDKRGVSNHIILQLHQLMDEIELHLYSPAIINKNMYNIYDKANELIQLLNTYKTK